ncbi:hypothetical protein GCM10009541_32770 [Micromonospora gifhornensis]|uniref:Uncharacterized protein n=1 Tax=Micromonospora gifhornensis TaxID=84594 RepID=A0ABQ4IA47_9ACTN|nr:MULTISPECIES: hypothetical protein [Micromonospora]PMR57607.1 hypothetical protein C1A38_29090 [Verrucosispora sp. ts21]GIJ14759.1 hypothetical protein Vgi01_14430 [Micromonospora gifhornensis]
MASVVGRAAEPRQGQVPLDESVVQRFYERMRAVAPAAVGAIERDRADDPARTFADTACGRLLRSLDDDGVRALGMWVHHWCMRFYDDDTWAALRLLREIAGRPQLGWTADEVHWMLNESHQANSVAAARLTLPLAAAAELAPGALRVDTLIPRQMSPTPHS